MALFVFLDGVVTPTTGIRMRADGYPGPQVAQAADGTMSQGAVTFEDDTGTNAVHGWQIVQAMEQECLSAPTIFYGAVGDHIERRGPYRLGQGRQIDCTLNDSNIFLACRLIQSDAARPAETDTARLAWLLGHASMSGLVWDLGLVNGAGRDFDAANYLGQYPLDVLNDLIGPRGQIFFTYWDQTAHKVGLFYDSPTATTFTSTLNLTNVLADVDATHLAVNEDWEQSFDASDVYDHIRYQYAHAVYYASNATTTAAFFNNVIGSRGINVVNDRVGLQTTAATFAARILARDGAEHAIAYGTLQVPAAQVGLIQPGMRIASVHLTHLTGFQTASSSRVVSMTIQQTDGHPETYDVGLVLSTYGPAGAGNYMGPPVPQIPATASVVQTGCGQNLGSSVDLIFPNPIAAGDMIVAWITSRGTSTDVSPPDGTWTTIEHVMLDSAGNPNNSPCALYCKIADTTEAGQTSLQFGSSNGSSRPKILGWELAGVGAPTHSVQATIQVGTPASLPALTVGAGIAIAGVGTGSDSPEPASLTPDDHFYVEAGDHFWPTAIGSDIATTSGTKTFTQTFTVSGGGNHWAGAAAFFPTGGGSSEPPVPGQFSPWTTITLAGAVGDIGFAYASGSLQIKVDGVLISPASYTENNTAGTFTLSWTPDTDEVVTARAQGII